MIEQDGEQPLSLSIDYLIPFCGEPIKLPAALPVNLAVPAVIMFDSSSSSSNDSDVD